MTAHNLGKLPAFPVGDQSGVSLRTLAVIELAAGLAARLSTQSDLHRRHLVKNARALADCLLEQMAKEKV